MNILFRYIARQYIVNIATLFVIAGALIVTVDVVINLDQFGRRAEILTAESGAGGGALHHLLLTTLLIIDLWGPRLLQLFTYLNGVVLIAAMGFTCAQLVRHRECVAMLAGGISLHRAAAPILAVAAAMFGVQAAVHEFALPQIAHLLTRSPRDAGKRSLEAFTLRLTPDDSDRLWYARVFDDESAALEDLAVWERDASGRPSRTLLASRAEWDGRGWTLIGGLAMRPPAGPDSQPAAPEPVDRIDGGLDPQRIKVLALRGFASTLSWRQIGGLIASTSDQRTIEQLDRARWSRIASMIGSMLALWGATSVFLIRAPRPMIGPALRAAPLALGGVIASAVASSASIPGLPVWVGAFLPCVVLLSIAIALATSVET